MNDMSKDMSKDMPSMDHSNQKDFENYGYQTKRF